MTDKRPQTIQFFLPQGEPRGIRIADITTRIVQAVLVPRSKLPDAAKREEIKSVGVYFLFGEPEEVAKCVVYGGEADPSREDPKCVTIGRENGAARPMSRCCLRRGWQSAT